MDSSLDDRMDEILEASLSDEGCDSGSTDDIIEDAEDNQEFEKDLDGETERANEIVSQPDVDYKFDDEEKVLNDSGGRRYRGF